MCICVTDLVTNVKQLEAGSRISEIYSTRYIWYALANWINGNTGSLPYGVLNPLAQLTVVSQFLAVALCVVVVMFGLMGIIRVLGRIFRLLFFTPQTFHHLRFHHILSTSALPPKLVLLSPVPPPIVVHDVTASFDRHHPNASASSAGIPEVVGTVMTGKTGQYVLFSNSSSEKCTNSASPVVVLGAEEPRHTLTRFSRQQISLTEV